MLIESETGTVVGRRWSRRAPAPGIGRVALSLERLKARHLGDAEADELPVTAAIGGVRAREAIGGSRAGTIESEHRLARGRRAARAAAAARSAAATPARAVARAASSRLSARAANGTAAAARARRATRTPDACGSVVPAGVSASRTAARSGCAARSSVRRRTGDAGATASVASAGAGLATGAPDLIRPATTRAATTASPRDRSRRATASASMSATSDCSTSSARVRPTAAVCVGLGGRATRFDRQQQQDNEDLPHEVAQGHPPCGHVLQETVIPVCTDPSTEQTPLQDCRQLQEIGDVPQLLVPHVTSTAPPALTKQS